MLASLEDRNFRHWAEEAGGEKKGIKRRRDGLANRSLGSVMISEIRLDIGSNIYKSSNISPSFQCFVSPYST